MAAIPLCCGARCPMRIHLGMHSFYQTLVPASLFSTFSHFLTSNLNPTFWSPSFNLRGLVNWLTILACCSQKFKLRCQPLRVRARPCLLSLALWSGILFEPWCFHFLCPDTWHNPICVMPLGESFLFPFQQATSYFPQAWWLWPGFSLSTFPPGALCFRAKDRLPWLSRFILFWQGVSCSSIPWPHRIVDCIIFLHLLQKADVLHK